MRPIRAMTALLPVLLLASPAAARGTGAGRNTGDLGTVHVHYVVDGVTVSGSCSYAGPAVTGTAEVATVALRTAVRCRVGGELFTQWSSGPVSALAGVRASTAPAATLCVSVLAHFVVPRAGLVSPEFCV